MSACFLVVVVGGLEKKNKGESVVAQRSNAARVFFIAGPVCGAPVGASSRRRGSDPDRTAPPGPVSPRRQPDSRRPDCLFFLPSWLPPAVDGRRVVVVASGRKEGRNGPFAAYDPSDSVAGPGRARPVMSSAHTRSGSGRPCTLCLRGRRGSFFLFFSFSFFYAFGEVMVEAPFYNIQSIILYN